MEYISQQYFALRRDGVTVAKFMNAHQSARRCLLCSRITIVREEGNRKVWACRLGSNLFWAVTMESTASPSLASSLALLTGSLKPQDPVHSDMMRPAERWYLAQ